MKGLKDAPDRTDLVNEIVETLDGGRRYKFEWRVSNSSEAERLLDERRTPDSADLEERFPQPLDAVRRELRIDPLLEP